MKDDTKDKPGNVIADRIGFDPSELDKFSLVPLAVMRLLELRNDEPSHAAEVDAWRELLDDTDPPPPPHELLKQYLTELGLAPAMFERDFHLGNWRLRFVTRPGAEPVGSDVCGGMLREFADKTTWARRDGRRYAENDDVRGIAHMIAGDVEAFALHQTGVSQRDAYEAFERSTEQERTMLAIAAGGRGALMHPRQASATAHLFETDGEHKPGTYRYYRPTRLGLAVLEVAGAKARAEKAKR